MLWEINLSRFEWLDREQVEVPRLERQNGTNLRLLRENHRSSGGVRSAKQMREEGKPCNLHVT